MSGLDFIVHDAADTVGVVVKEGVQEGAQLTGWVMETGESPTIEAIDDIPLGHKVALAEIEDGATIIKYGHDIGESVASIARGGHVHTQNVKTKRW